MFETPKQHLHISLFVKHKLPLLSESESRRAQSGGSPFSEEK